MLEAWQQSDSGRGLIAALEERGFKVAQGRMARFVVVDRYGDIKNPVRLIPGIRAKDMHERLKDVDVSTYPDADLLSKQRRAEHAAEKPGKTQQAALNRVPDLKPKFESTAQRVDEDSQLTRAFEKTLRRDQQIEEQIGEKLANLQSQQLDERGKLAQKHALRVMRLKEELSAFYQLPDHRREISVLRDKCRNPSIWRRLFGLVRRDRQELVESTQSYRNAYMRYKERIDSLNAQNAREIQRLKTRHQRAWEFEYRRLFNCRDWSGYNFLKSRFRAPQRNSLSLDSQDRCR